MWVILVRISHAEQAVIASTREQPSWLATVAHELRGPVSALETASELLDRDFEVLDAAQIRTMVSSIHRRTLWLRGLMENLLCSAAIDEGRFSVHTQPLDIVETAREVEAMVGPVLARKRQTTRVTFPATCPLVDADAHRIAQVLLNLLTNANKYADPGTEIEIAVAAERGAVRISVSDRGPGLPASKTDSAFRPYDRAGRRDGEGLGIGLWVVRSIISAHGGQVGAANRAGGGATFWFELRPMSGLPSANLEIENAISETSLVLSAV